MAGALMGASLAALLLNFPYSDVARGRDVWEAAVDATRAPALFFSSLAFGSTAVALAMLSVAERRALQAAPNAPLWRELARLFQQRDAFFAKLSAVETSAAESPPEAPLDGAEAGGCLALFEQCETLIRLGLVDERRFRKVYAARLRVFASHPAVRLRLLDEERTPRDHPDFVVLCRRCEVPWRESPFS